MSPDEESEKELIALSKDQRAFFEKHLPGAKLYPFQERLLKALANFKGKIMIGFPRHGKSIFVEQVAKAVEKAKVGEKCSCCGKWTYDMEPGSFKWTEPRIDLAWLHCSCGNVSEWTYGPFGLMIETRSTVPKEELNAIHVGK